VLSKAIFIIGRKIKTFPDKQKLMGFLNTKPVLPKILKVILLIEGLNGFIGRVWECSFPFCFIGKFEVIDISYYLKVW
jgi:hypothetical protein